MVQGVLNEVSVRAPAKVNLVLKVLDRRPDGYHNLWSLMQTVGLEDELRVRTMYGHSGVRLTCNDPGLPTDGRNLVTRAASLVLTRIGISVGLDIHLSKRIPAAAGLGGGSSDAAATIVALNCLFALGWSASEMVRLGQQLGSDVPFFFFAPTALVRGRGEEVAPLSLWGTRWLVLVNPGFPIQTRWAYERLAESRRTVPQVSEALDRVAGKGSLSWEEVIPVMENDFEGALAATHPVLAEIKMELIQSGAEAALLSGSGATVFGVFPDEMSARRAEDALGRALGCWVYAAPASRRTLATQNNQSGSPLCVG